MAAFRTVRFLNLVRPFLPFLPEVSSPDRKVCILASLAFLKSHRTPPGTLQPKSTMDGRHALHFLGLLAGSVVRYHVV